MSTKQKQTVTDISLTVNDIHQSVVSYATSQKYVKKILPLSIINILYHRINIDRNQFKKHKIEEFEYMTHKMTATNAIIKQYYGWVKGARDAIDKNYLKEFYLFLKVANGSEEDVKEFYKFSMKYIDEEKVAKQGPVDLMKSTCDLFKVIEGLGNIEKCDEKSIEVKVQLTYYEDKTPLMYEPPFFTQSTSNLIPQIKEKFERNLTTVQGGLLNTGFHRMKCVFGGSKFKVNSSRATSVISERIIVLDDESTCAEDMKSLMLERGKDDDVFSETGKKSTKKGDQADVISLSDDNSIATTMSRIIREYNVSQIDCTCKSDFYGYWLNYVFCTECKVGFHCPCQGYLNAKECPKSFVCSKCEKKKNGVDPEQDDDQITTLSCLRLVLAYCYKTQKVPNEIIKGFNISLIDELMVKLQELQVITEQKDNGFAINFNHIEKNLINKFFIGQTRTEPNSMMLPEAVTEDPELDYALLKKQKLN